MSDLFSQLAQPEALWPMLIGTLCSVSCGLLGCYLVLRRMSLLGDAISHAVLPGIAIAFFITGSRNELPIMLGAMALGVLTSFLTQALQSFGNVPEDSSMGVTYTSLFALGVILITRAASNVDLDANCFLYGVLEIAGLNVEDYFGFELPRTLIPLSIALSATVGFIWFFRKELKIVSFDPDLARAMGISAALVHYLLMAMVAGVTVASFEAVGSILVVAMLIVPGATAHLLTDRMAWMLVWATVVAVISAVVGYAGAVALNTSAAGMMAVVAGVQFGLAVFFAPAHGLVSKWLRNFRLAVRIAAEDLLATLYRAEEAAQAGTAIDEARFRGGSGRFVSAVAVAAAIAQNQIRFSNGRLELTPAGHKRAESLVRSHRLWELYLEQNFELPPDHLHEPASRIEHFITPELQEELAADLAQPGADPQGHVIPPA